MHSYSDSNELEKSKAHIVVEIIEYLPNAVVSKTIIKKSTGNITVSSFDAGEELAEKTSPFRYVYTDHRWHSRIGYGREENQHETWGWYHYPCTYKA